MTQSDKIPRIPYRRQIYFDQLGEVHSTISGERALKFALPKFLYAPTPEELREMLRELRLECQWSQALLAAMMGIPKATLRRWEDGSRNPCRAAAKLIWIMHQLFTDRPLPYDAFDWAVWGHCPNVVYVMED